MCSKDATATIASTRDQIRSNFSHTVILLFEWFTLAGCSASDAIIIIRILNYEEMKKVVGLRMITVNMPNEMKYF